MAYRVIEREFTNGAKDFIVETDKPLWWSKKKKWRKCHQENWLCRLFCLIDLDHFYTLQGAIDWIKEQKRYDEKRKEKPRKTTYKVVYEDFGDGRIQFNF